MDYKYPIRRHPKPIDLCPICGSDDTEGDAIDVGKYVAQQECGCNTCGAQFEIVFQAIRKTVFLPKR